jgi:hypothetical protein
LAQPLIFTSATVRIVIPRGFITDLASIPHILDWVPFLDRDGLSRRAAGLHDGMYSLGRERGKDYADAMLRAACLSEGMRPWEAACFYQAVQRFGRPAWDDDARAGTFGVITSGDFIDIQSFEDWKAAGSTIFTSR